MIYSTSFDRFHLYYSAEEVFMHMAKIGYGACDLNLGLRKSVFDHTDENRVKFLRSLPASAKKYGVRIGQTHSAFFFDDRYDKEYVDEYIRLKKEEILLTAELDCPYMVLHPLLFTGWNPNPNPERAKKENICILKELSSFAKAHGVILALENMPGAPNCNFACSTAWELLEYIHGVHSDNLCACLDFGHANISVQREICKEEKSIAQYVTILGEKIRCLHLHDNNGKQDLHALPLSVNEGGIAWEESIIALKKVGYRGTFNSESIFSSHYPKHLYPLCEELQLAVLKELSKPLLD